MAFRRMLSTRRRVKGDSEERSALSPLAIDSDSHDESNEFLQRRHGPTASTGQSGRFVEMFRSLPARVRRQRNQRQRRNPPLRGYLGHGPVSENNESWLLDLLFTFIMKVCRFDVRQ